MRVRIITEDQKVFEAQFGRAIHVEPYEIRYQITEVRENARTQLGMSPDQFIIYTLDFKSPAGCELELISAEAQVEMSILMKGEMTCDFHLPQGAIQAGEQAYNIYCSQTGSRKIKLCSPVVKWMIIAFPVDRFCELIPDSNRFESFRRTLSENQPQFLYSEFQPLTMNMLELLRDIRRCTANVPFQCILIKIKVLELLWNQLKTSMADQNPETDIPDSEYQKICQAKTLVEKHFVNPPGLSELARRVGSNEFYLKKGFKSLTGTSVFKYVRDLKMKKAIHLLREPNRTIQEIAEAVGYKYAQHFSTAFKKSYGMTPGKYRKKYL